MGRATRKGAAGLWAGCCPLGPFRRPPIAPRGGPPSPRWAGRPSRAAFKLPRRSAGRPAGRTAPAPGSARSARGPGRLRPPGTGGAEGAQHGHHPMGPLCAPEHLRGERPGRSRAGQKARPRSARRAWPCLLSGRRKRPHRCPAGACGSMKRGRGPAGRRTAAGGERPRRRLRPPERGGRKPAWWPALPIFHLPRPAANKRGREGVPGAGCASGAGRPLLDAAFRQQGKREEQRSALADCCSSLDSRTMMSTRRAIISVPRFDGAVNPNFG